MSSKRRAYTLEEKKEVIEWILSQGDCVPTRAAKQFRLPPGTVRTWWNSREEILNTGQCDLSRQRLPGAGTKGVMIDHDEEISEKILFLRHMKERVTRQVVKNIAKAVAERENIEDFRASDGWLTKFIYRNSFSFRRVLASWLFLTTDPSNAHLNI